MTRKGNTQSQTRNRSKSAHPIERFVAENNLKLVWLAREVGISTTALRAHFRNGTLPKERERAAVGAIKALGKRCAGFQK